MNEQKTLGRCLSDAAFIIYAAGYALLHTLFSKPYRADTLRIMLVCALIVCSNAIVEGIDSLLVSFFGR